MADLDPQLIDELVSAYVLGTLTKAERAYVEQLMRGNHAVAQAVHEWQNLLLPLASGVPEATPPPRVWEAIEATITAPRFAEKTDRWRLHWKRYISVAALAMGMMLGVGVTLLVQRNESVPESYVGFLAAKSDTSPSMHASARRGESVLFVKMITPVVNTGDRVLVLWGLNADSPPRRLGVVQPSGKTRIALDAPADVTFKNISTLALSSEPANKRIPLKPSSEFILKGPCVKLW